MRNPDCIFCKIIEGKIGCDNVYEDDSVLAFLDINPVNPGHVLVIPKEHYKLMNDVPDELISDVFVKCKMLMERVKEVTKADYVALAVVGVDVTHFHVHLVPRYFNDGMANLWPTKKYKEGESKELAEKIRNKK